MTLMIGAVVEGHGEVGALPVLLRRICQDHGIFDVTVSKPHRLPRAEMTREKVSAAVRMQRLRVGTSGVVVVLYDSDDDEPAAVRRQTLDVLGDNQAVVAVAVREYEAWFLAALRSLRKHEHVRDDATFEGDPESPRDAKGRLSDVMTEKYRETLHQARFSAVMSLAEARENSASFSVFEQHLLKALGH